jgi:hypothetical protein
VFDTFGLTYAPHGRRWLAACAACAAIVIETLSLRGVIPYVVIGGIAVSWSLVPAVALAVACGPEIAGRQQSRVAAVVFGAIAGLTLIVASALLIAGGHGLVLTGLIVVAATEELVYRLAIPALAAGVLHLVGVPAKVARPLGFVAGGVWFVLLPGHRQQWTTNGNILAFMAFATLAAMVVYSSRAVLAAALVHLATDVLTSLYVLGQVTLGQRGALVAALLALMVLAYSSPEYRRERRRLRRQARLSPSGRPNPTS